MITRKYKLHDGKTGSALTVRLTSKTNQNAVVGIMSNGTVKIDVTAASTNGEDNEALINLIADVLSVPKSKVAIVAGMTGRDKIISVLGLDAITMTKLIRDHLA